MQEGRVRSARGTHLAHAFAFVDGPPFVTKSIDELDVMGDHNHATVLEQLRPTQRIQYCSSCRYLRADDQPIQLPLQRSPSMGGCRASA